ncbi:M18 family aminopeptidase [uncultured Streptomyces sp.]|uniref:M18 family aminopeptidase n=1 Tax=uncultured Streptomyces sp. TaxID=174707 RepID=UPI00262C7464|nr:M18 family aminopeptidase [uncultured Streptomyces sp.]
MTPAPHRSPVRAHSDDLLAFISSAPSPYHAVASAAARLEKAGFRERDATEDWTGTTGGGYVTRGGALIAWYVPEGAPAHTPFRIVGTHTDSPNLRVKPAPDTGTAGWRQIGVEIYGGVPLNTWLDRDLGLSGRLALRGGPDGPRERLVLIDEPLLRVPQLAIHLDRQVNEGALLDRQRHLAPVWALGDPVDGALLRRVAAAIDEDPADVLGWDLMLHDVQPPGYLGAEAEFVVAPRLDNLVSVHAGVTALVDAATGDRPPAYVPVLAAFDHEEVGSVSETGAQSPMLERVLSRSVTARGGSGEDWSRALAGTFCVSADMAHAVHPNYTERHDAGHRPLPNGGPTVKVNTNQRYATDSTGIAVFAAACERARVAWQPFAVNNAMPCGTSIGPLTAARLGVPTVDVGVAGLSMHSARELCGAQDPAHLSAVLREIMTAG